MIAGIEKMPVQPPDPQHITFISEWSSQIILGLVTILVIVVRFIGKGAKSDSVPIFVTRSEMIECQEKLMEEFKGMRKDVNDKIDHAHEELHQEVRGAHARIDILFQRDT